MDNQRKKVSKSCSIALSGVMCSLAMLVMFLTGMLPMVATFVLPAISGILLLVLYYELGFKTAMLAYIATSMLSIFMVPDREAALFFICFFGHYPIIRFKIEEKIKSKTGCMLFKLLVFNLCFLVAYFFVALIFGMDYVISSNAVLKYVVITFAVLGNITFILYDFVLTNLTYIYNKMLRDKISPHIR